MKKVLLYILILCGWLAKAQQTMLYTQYLFNKAGANPAASGTDINQKYNYVFGINRQWVGFDHAPKQNFANVSLTIRPPRSYRFWQNVGVYVDNEETGIFSSNGLYGNYTFHLLVRKKWVVSFGGYLGMRMFYVSRGSLDQNDPVNQSGNFRALMYPDVMPGFRVTNKRFFFDLSAKQITITRLKDFSGNRIGSPSQLRPVLYAGVGTRISLGDQFLLMPAMAVNASVVHIPAVDMNVMLYYSNIVGAGVAVRNASFLSMILQLRLFENLSAGLAYSYSINAARYAAPNSFEIMLGVTPFGMNDRIGSRHSVARCPVLSF